LILINAFCAAEQPLERETIGLTRSQRRPDLCPPAANGEKSAIVTCLVCNGHVVAVTLPEMPIPFILCGLTEIKDIGASVVPWLRASNRTVERQ